MAYTINKSDGTELTKIVDGTIDQTSTDLTLLGRNSASYGFFINENFVKLLENFASENPPEYAVTGQLWFDTSDGRLKVYDPVAGGFKVSGGTIVSSIAPSTITAGDIWIDSERKQLYFNDGTATYLAGPQYTEQQGVSGFNVTTIVDVNEVPHTCVFLYVSQALIGIFSKTSFIPAEIIPGFGSFTIPEGEPNAGSVVSNPVNVGFNAGNLANLKFNVTSTKADGILGIDGETVETAGYFLSSVNNETSAYGSLKIQGGPNQTPLYLGPSFNNKIQVTTQSFEIGPNQNFAINQNFKISTQPSSGVATTNIFINAQNQYVGIHTDAPTTSLDIAGNTRVRNSLIVEGTLQLSNSTPPVTLDAEGTVGQVTWDNNYIYICVATDTWKRAGLSVTGAGLLSVSQDTSPSLGGNLNLNTRNITGTGNISITGTVTSTGIQSSNNTNLSITAPGTGYVLIENIRYPSVDGTSGQFLQTDGSAVLSWSSASLANLSDVDYDPAPTNGQVLRYNSSSSKWEPSASGGNRTTVSGTTPSLSDNASAQISITGSKGYFLYKIQTNAAAWVRIYTSSAARTADASRIEGDDPLPGAGVIAEVITTGAETVVISPGVIGYNDEVSPNTSIFLTVKNKSGVSSTITVQLTIVTLET